MFSRATSLYDRQSYSSARSVYEELLEDPENNHASQDCVFNIASCWASEGMFEKAISIISKIEDSPSGDLQYNKALCFYKLSNLPEALNEVEVCVEKCQKRYMELVLTAEHDELERHTKLQESCLIEALNLKAAILSKLNENRWLPVRQCLDRVPLDNQELLDSVTLHNQAICDHSIDTDASIDKLSFLCNLLDQSTQEDSDKDNGATVFIPDEVFINLLLLYSQTGYSEIGLEFLKKNRDQIEKVASKELIQFISAQLERHIVCSDEVVYSKFDKLLGNLIELVQMKDEKRKSDEERERTIELILSVVTYQGSILWDNGYYQLLEGLLLKVKPVLSDNELWKTNFAHAVFMQDTRYDECNQLYEDLVVSDSLLNVDADILSNLCVSYVLTGQNSDAEALIKNVESEELQLSDNQDHSGLNRLYLAGESIGDESEADAGDRSEKPFSHLCQINLCIGTLYCVKYNYKFGLTRMFKSLEPLETKLNGNNWFYVKKCILALLDGQCKQMLWANDDTLNQVVSFLIQCERYGVLVEANKLDLPISSANKLIDRDYLDQFHKQNSVSSEARHLRSIVLSLLHD